MGTEMQSGKPRGGSHTKQGCQLDFHLQRLLHFHPVRGSQSSHTARDCSYPILTATFSAAWIPFSALTFITCRFCAGFSPRSVPM